MRIDLQAIQSPVINGDNYNEELPRIVSTIWRYYSDRRSSKTILEERGKRAELENELREYREREKEQIFSKQEQEEFEYIFERLDIATIVYEETSPYGGKRIRITVSMIVFFYLYYSPKSSLLGDDADPLGELPAVGIAPPRNQVKYKMEDYLFQYGLKKRHGDEYGVHRIVTDKLHRFRYWMEYNNKIDGRELIIEKTVEDKLTRPMPEGDDGLPF